MSRNGSGVYTLPAGNPVVTNTTISSSWANSTLTNIASALTDSLAADGQTTATGNLKMGANRITGLAEGITSTDAVTKGYVDTADAALTAAIAAAVAAVPPVVTGTISMWPTSTAPTGYLLCAGAAVSRTTYAALFAIVGTTFGVGDGSTTFNLPNYTNRMPYGTTIGTTGGSADAIVVSHTHTATSTVTDPSHNHAATTGNFVVTSGGAQNWTGGNSFSQQPTTASATTGITVATTNTSTGSSGTNANLPPYLGINFIIKT